MLGVRLSVRLALPGVTLPLNGHSQLGSRVKINVEDVFIVSVSPILPVFHVDRIVASFI